MNVYVYENNDDSISAVVMNEDAVKNIVSGFEDEDMSRSEFIAAARSGFEGAGSYDASNFSGMDMRQAAKHMEETDRLIAEITPDSVAMYPEKMGLSGHILFEFGESI